MNKLTFAIVTALTLSASNYILAMTDETQPEAPLTPTTLQQKSSFVFVGTDEVQLVEGADEDVFEPRNPSSRRVQNSPKFPDTPRPKRKLPAASSSLPPAPPPSMDLPPADRSKPRTPPPPMEYATEETDQPEGLHRTLTDMTYNEVLASPLLESIKREESVSSVETEGEDD